MKNKIKKFQELCDDYESEIKEKDLKISKQKNLLEDLEIKLEVVMEQIQLFKNEIPKKRLEELR